MIASDVRLLQVAEGGNFAIAITGDDRVSICTWPDLRVENILVPPHGEKWLLASAHGHHRLVSSAPDGSIAFWQVPSGPRGPTLAGNGGRVTTLSFLADGRWLSGTEQGEVVVWSVDDRPIHRIPAASNEIAALFADFPGDRLLVKSPSGGVTCWCLADGSAAGALPRSEEFQVCAMTPDGRTFVGMKHFNTACRLYFYDAPTYSLRAVLDIEKAFGKLTTSPCGQYLLLAVAVDVDDDEVRVLSLPAGEHWASFTSLGIDSAFSPDGQFWVDVEWPDVRVFDGRTFRLLTKHRVATSWSPAYVAFGPGSRHLVVAQLEQTVQVWDMADLTPRASDWGARPESNAPPG